MLLSGMDVSGDNKDGNYKFLAIVIGTKDNINSLFHSIGKKKIHMNQIQDKNQRKRIINTVSFDGKNRTAFCLAMNRKNIIDKVTNLRKIKQKRMPKSRIIRVYNYLLFQYVKPEIEQFIIKNGYAMTDMIIQCEEDCVSIAKDNSLFHTNIGIAYRISDIVAWCNSHNITLSGVVEKDFTDQLECKLIERLTR